MDHLFLSLSSYSSADRQRTVHTWPEQIAETALMSCTKWHQPLKDLLVSSQQSQISFSLLSQPLFLVVTVSTAPLRQPEATVAGGWLAGKRQGFIPAFTGTDSALGLRNNSGLEHCQTISSEEGRVAVQEPACCGVTRLRTPAQPPIVSILGHPSSSG